MEQVAQTYGPLAIEVAFTLVGLLIVSLRGAIDKALDAWAGRQTEEKDAQRILKLKSIVGDALDTVQTNIIAELEKDVRKALADGKLDDKERAALRGKIASYAQTTLGDQGVAAAKEAFGVGSDKLEDWLANRLEGRVVAAVQGS